MSKKLPGIYQNHIPARLSNNTNVFYSQYENVFPKANGKVVSSVSQESEKKPSVEEMIQEIFGTSGYVFNIPVEIRTHHQTYDTYIATKAKNNLITMDNEIIPIREIVSIQRKDRI